MNGSNKSIQRRKHPWSGESGGSERVLLLVLLFVVLLFGYVYFFTGLIKPHEETAQAPPVETPVVKKPIPPRTGTETAKNEAAPAGESKNATPAGNNPAEKEKAKPAPAPAPVKQEQPAKVPAPSKQAATKPNAAGEPQGFPTAAPAKQATKDKEAKPKEVVPQTKQNVKSKQAVEPKGPKQDPAGGKAVKPQTAPEKPVKAEKAGVAKPEKKPAAKAKPAGKFSVVVGEYVLPKDVKNAENKIRKSGIGSPSITTTKKVEQMHRVHVADFASRKDAEAEVAKLKKVTGSAFILPIEGKHSVFAGSFFNEAQAVKEKERIAASSGNQMKVDVQTAQVTIPVKRVTVGGFATKESAMKAAAALENAGLKATVTDSRK